MVYRKILILFFSLIILSGFISADVETKEVECSSDSACPVGQVCDRTTWTCAGGTSDIPRYTLTAEELKNRPGYSESNSAPWIIGGAIIVVAIILAIVIKNKK